MKNTLVKVNPPIGGTIDITLPNGVGYLLTFEEASDLCGRLQKAVKEIERTQYTPVRMGLLERLVWRMWPNVG